MAVALANTPISVARTEAQTPSKPSDEKMLRLVDAAAARLSDVDLTELLGSYSDTTENTVRTLEAQDPSESALKDKWDSNQAFELAYQEIGSTRGINATPEGRRRTRRTWVDSGAQAAKWLISRLRTETDAETIVGIGEILADIGECDPLLAELEASNVSEHLIPLVEALAYMPVPEDGYFQARIFAIAERYYAAKCADYRLAAVQLAPVLSQARAARLLRRALNDCDSDVRDEAEALLAEIA